VASGLDKEVTKMKKLLIGTILLVLVSVFPVMTMAAVDVSVGISLPPLIVFGAPPAVVILPDTNSVYVVPNIEADFFFWNGWWWRPWEGRWYRSRYYNRGWGYYSSVPRFYYDVDPGWRGYYRDRNWSGHHWAYEQIPNQRLQQNWKSWQSNRYWEKKKTWGVQGYSPKPQQQRQELRQQRQVQYQQRPEVQQHIQKQQQQKQQVQKQQKSKVQQPQRQEQQRQTNVQKSQDKKQKQTQVQQSQQQRQEQQRQPMVQKPQQQHQPQVKQPQGQQKSQQQHSRPQDKQQQGESQHQQSQGKPEGGDPGHRK